MFAISIFMTSPGMGMGLDFGGGGGGTPPPPATGSHDIVDTMGGLTIPTRVTVSSSGEVFVSDHEQGRVVVFDATGKKIRTLTNLEAPLGLAVFEGTPAALPVPADCPQEQAQYQAQMTKYQARLVRFTGLATKYGKLLNLYQEKLAAAAGDKRKQRRYGQRVRVYGKRVARYQARIQIYDDLITTYAACDIWSTDPLPPLPVIYVGDEGDGSVQVINNGKISKLGSGAGEFIKPNGIAVTATQNAYVVDSGTHQVRVYNGFGTLLFSFGSEGSGTGQFNFPIDIALNESLGEVYVTDFWNERVVVFDLAGNWLRNLPAPLNNQGDPAFFRPSGLGIDPDGNLYIVDTALSSVTIITSLGALLNIIGYVDDQYWTGELELPLDAAADGSRVYVTSNRFVQVFQEATP